jgi:hypothetical protein
MYKALEVKAIVRTRARPLLCTLRQCVEEIFHVHTLALKVTKHTKLLDASRNCEQADRMLPAEPVRRWLTSDPGQKSHEIQPAGRCISRYLNKIFMQHADHDVVWDRPTSPCQDRNIVLRNQSKIR